VSPDVALAEVEVRRMYRKWMKMIQDNNNKKSSTKKDDGGEEVKDEELSLIEESGWLHASHHQRDFVFVEGKENVFCLFGVALVSSPSLAPHMHRIRCHCHSLSQ